MYQTSKMNSRNKGVELMHHNLDIRPVPKQPFYINEPGLIDGSLWFDYRIKRKIPADELIDYKTAIKAQDYARAKWFDRYEEDEPDNIRVYIPLDLNEKAILRRLDEIIGRYGAASEYNESNYRSEVDRVISQLEIYDQVWFSREMRGRAKGHSDALPRNSKDNGSDGSSNKTSRSKETEDVPHVPLSPDEHVRSQHGVDLAKKVIKKLEDIPDACAELFPFETIDELNKEWLGIITRFAF